MIIYDIIGGKQMRNSFIEKLNQLNNDLIKMGGLVEDAIKNAAKALEEDDVELAKKIIAGDSLVNEAEKKIESQSLNIILREQPVAGDLRKVSAALKMVTDMERIADNAADIAEIIVTANVKSILHISASITEMAEKASRMVGDAVKSFVDVDLELAQQVVERDDEVDALFNEIKTILIENISHDKSNVDIIVDTIMIIKYFERIADHAVNICEWVYFFETGEYKSTQII